MPRRPAQPAPLVPRVKVWLEAGEDYAFGYRLATMLQAVERHGSIKRAAAEVGQSYRYVWGRVKGAEKALGLQLVETKVGGEGTRRSALTPEARRLVEEFLAVRRRLTEALDEEFARHFQSLLAEGP